MNSTEHAAVGAVASALAVGALAARRPLSRARATALWAYGVALSVGIDVDHFPIARAETGDWDALRRALRRPTAALTDPDYVFPDVELASLRLLSHAVLGGALTALLFLVAPPLGVFTAVVLYAHVVADLLRDAGVA